MWGREILYPPESALMTDRICSGGGFCTHYDSDAVLEERVRSCIMAGQYICPGRSHAISNSVVEPEPRGVVECVRMGI